MNECQVPRRYLVNNDTVAAAEMERFTERNDVRLNDGLGSKWMVWKRRRYFIVMLIFLGELTKEILRTNFSVAVLAMTDNRTITDESGNTTYVQEFDWDVKTRGFLLSVFYYGFTATHIFGGILAVKYGGIKMYGLGVIITAVSTLLTPAAAYIHFYLLIALRVFEGFCEGIVVPSMDLIFARWIPLQERSSIVAFTFTGDSWGVMFGISISSAVAYIWGWSAIFYITGCIGITWCMVWFFFAKEYPVLEKNISSTELTYIQQSVGKMRQGKTKVSSIPFRSILTSVPFLSLILSYTPVVTNYVIFSTQLPAYIKDVLRLDTQNSGYLTSFPFAAKVLMMYCISPTADYLVNKNILSKTATRKLYICGCLTAMGLLSFVIQLATTTTAIMACLIVINVCSGIGVVQIVVNMLDLAPKFSSILSGIILTVSSICGMFVPTLIGYLTQNKTPEEWHTVFSIQAGACMFGAAIYGVLGSGRLQSWAAARETVTADSAEDGC